MDFRKEGGPAFPVPCDRDPSNGQGIREGADGMSLRDYFAGQVVGEAFAKMASHPVSMTSPTINDVAEKAYRLADAMLAARKK